MFVTKTNTKKKKKLMSFSKLLWCVICTCVCDIFQFNVYKSKLIYTQTLKSIIFNVCLPLTYTTRINCTLTRLFSYDTIFKKTAHWIVYSPKIFWNSYNWIHLNSCQSSCRTKWAIRVYGFLNVCTPVVCAHINYSTYPLFDLWTGRINDFIWSASVAVRYRRKTWWSPVKECRRTQFTRFSR